MFQITKKISSAEKWTSMLTRSEIKAKLLQYAKQKDIKVEEAKLIN